MCARSIAVLLVWGITVPLARGELRPMPPDPYDPHQAQMQQAPQTVPAPAAASNNNKPPIPALPASNDYPAYEVQMVPIAYAQLAMTRAQLDRAQRALSQVIDQLKEDYEFSAGVLAAMRDQKTAQERHNAARERVLRQVSADRQYQTLKDLYANLNERLSQLKEAPYATASAGAKAEILATAELKLAYGSRMSDIESEALEADSATQQARAQLVEATAKLNEMRSAFNRQAKRDPKFVAARREIEDLRVARSTAAAFFTATVGAREIALDYAYNLHIHDPYHYIGTPYPFYDYYGSNYGYTNAVYNPVVRTFPW